MAPSDTAIENFRARLSADQGFAERIKACLTAGEIIAVAQTEGITLTDSDLARTVVQGAGELSDEELENVSVGTALAVLVVK